MVASTIQGAVDIATETSLAAAMIIYTNSVPCSVSDTALSTICYNKTSSSKPSLSRPASSSSNAIKAGAGSVGVVFF